MWPVAHAGAGGTVGGAIALAAARFLAAPWPAPGAEPPGVWVPPAVPGPVQAVLDRLEHPPSGAALVAAFIGGYLLGVVTGPAVDVLYLARRGWERCIAYLEGLVGPPPPRRLPARPGSG